ncbi:hypothetical protein [Sphingomonas sp. CFBP 13706]|uniref:hypothetical protein n=1 Tax=Sphingomonas sp. CFBP 13706 TaxID=2775314 RepID=UPI001786A3B6|nr:hypothetical protein [Sphingomonas sp. CFBP 13706]MBD8736859.1 hypothetical protein [Sphingomonas sp. CFBP 13706]
MGKPSTVVFWGAGATANLGMRMTAEQSDFILTLAGVADLSPASLAKRVEGALGPGANALQRKLLVDLLTILGDGAAFAVLHDPTGKQLAAMKRNWRTAANDDELRARVRELRLVYDWPALQDVLRVCPGAAAGVLKINDLFNMLDMHVPLGHGFRTEQGAFLDTRRLMGAKAALRMLLHAMFYIDWQNCVRDRGRPLETYEQFAEWLGRRMYRSEPSFSGRLDRPEFIRSDIAFVSLNYDPIGLWTQFFANRRLNKAPDVEKVDGASRCIQLYHDMGHFIPSRRIEPAGRPDLWYPMNEASAQRINEIDAAGSERIRLSKFLFPHGCLCWRECPDCGKLSAYHGDEWTLRSPSLLPPPPLRRFDRRSAYPDLAALDPADRDKREKESNLWSEGVVDARACLHCHTITTTEHAQTVMQSSFKQTPPSFIDEIQRDLRAIVMQADHVILMGYSLPPDDVAYRAFFAARRRRTAGGTPVRCTVVGFDRTLPPLAGPGGIDPDVLARQPAVASAREIFGEDNVRFCGEGVPGSFCDASGVLSGPKLDALFEWKLV